LLFNKDINDIQVFLFGKGAQFRDLVLNRPHLFIFHIRGLAGVEEKFMLFHIHVFIGQSKYLKSQGISNLRLASRAVRGEPVFPYLSALRAAESIGKIPESLKINSGN